MREVGVHLHHQLGAAGERAAKARDVGGTQPLLALAVEDLDVVVLGGETVGDAAGAVGRVVVHDQDPAIGGQPLTDSDHQPLEVVGLVVGRQDHPDAASGRAVGGFRHAAMLVAEPACRR